MKVEFIVVTSGKEKWLEMAKEHYIKKLKPFCDFTFSEIKTKSFSRQQAEQKKQFETEKLLSKIDPTDLVCLLDEGGREMDSIEFSKQLQSFLESGKRRVVFVIGGAFGVEDTLKKRANLKWALSKMVLSHHTAQVTALEQVYRGFTIIKGIPYHNV